MFLFFNPRLTQQKKRSSEFWPHLGVDLAWPQGNFPTFPPLSPGLLPIKKHITLRSISIKFLMTYLLNLYFYGLQVLQLRRGWSPC